MINHHLVVFI